MSRDVPSGIDSATRDELKAYFHGTTAEDIAPFHVESLADIAGLHLDFGRNRKSHERLIRTFTAADSDARWSAPGCTVIQMVVDDRVFLVNSIVPFIAENDLVIQRIFHPVLWVSRDDDGTLQSVRSYDPARPDTESDEIREAWIHIELDEALSEEQIAELQQGLLDVIDDVRIVTDDWQAMLDVQARVLGSLDNVPAHIDPADVDQARDFLRWMRHGHFTYIGYREYRIEPSDTAETMQAIPDTGLGILRESRLISHAAQNEAAAEAAKTDEHPLLLITKADSVTSVRRRSHLDRISIRTFDEDGQVIGEHRFLGLFASATYAESVRRIPMLANKADAVLAHLRFAPDSYNGKAVLALLEGFPRDELFSADVADLARICGELIYVRGRRHLRCFVRRDQLGRFLSVLVYMPRDRYTERARHAIEDILQSICEGGVSMEHSAWVTEAKLARLHVVVRPEGARTVAPVDEEDLQQRMREAVRTWDDAFVEAVHNDEDLAAEAEQLIDLARALPDAYREDFGAATALVDLQRLRSVPSGEIALSFREGTDRLTVYRSGAALSLAELLPLFSSLGVEILDERPYELAEQAGWIYDFSLQHKGEGHIDQALFRDAFLACWTGEAEIDGYNRLVVRAGLPWRDVVVLRAYAKYLRQGGVTFSDEFVQTALQDHPKASRLLVELFDARFNPERHDSLDARKEAQQEIEDRVEAALDEVESRDADTVLRSVHTLIDATTRTNYFQTNGDGQPKDWLSLKIEPTAVDFLPEPRPQFEIYCYSPRVEGVHLRFGLVARGGLRWSDRREDFRTEVLGLVKSQMVKNTVIVPTGSKGGFYAKMLPDPSEDRDAWMEEGRAAYRIFISAMLDITDNREGDDIIAPPNTVRWDGDDSYLVVAADKGTATFSDLANEVAESYGFWLGDAFASGGSAGYDHKAMGITARGAWESVKRHFREQGIDCQSEDFTAVGIGDMSGDVFGNGMLRSRHIRLVGAFDHRHIFIDPNPDADTSFDERKRLFELPRSSWADYDTSLISEGGGIFDRSAKSIEITDQMREALGLAEEVTSLSPPELIGAVLKAPVDLLWNGGIGTYVKSESESNSDVGDKANDAIRVDGGALRCKVVGEGGNLGFTQLGRVDYALNGGQINTDFIDNSAGVDSSDYEVNIKILLRSAIDAGDLAAEDRDELLASMTDEVADLVLDHNVQQNLTLSTATYRAADDSLAHHDLIRSFERSGSLDRKLEALPSENEMSRRHSDGQGLTSPELAVLLAYTKMELADALTDSPIASEPLFTELLHEYFPTPLRERFASHIESHPLRDEIVITRVVNTVVDAVGLTYFYRVGAETGAPADMLARAQAVAEQLLDANRLLRELDYDHADLDAELRTQVRIRLRDQVERAARWLITTTREQSAREVVAELSEPLSGLLQSLPELLAPRERERFEADYASETQAGLPENVARRAALAGATSAIFGIAQLAIQHDTSAAKLAEIYGIIGERLGMDLLAQEVDALPDDGRWLGMARSALADDVLRTQLALTADVLEHGDSSQPAADQADAWLAERQDNIEDAHELLRSMWAEGEFDIARLTVSLQMAKRLLH